MGGARGVTCQSKTTDRQAPVTAWDGCATDQRSRGQWGCDRHPETVLRYSAARLQQQLGTIHALQGWDRLGSPGVLPSGSSPDIPARPRDVSSTGRHGPSIWSPPLAPAGAWLKWTWVKSG